MSISERLFSLPDGTYLAPSAVKIAKRLRGKGVGLFNEYTDMIGFIAVADEAGQTLALELLKPILTGNGRWRQPDWSGLQGAVEKPADPKAIAAPEAVKPTDPKVASIKVDAKVAKPL